MRLLAFVLVLGLAGCGDKNGIKFVKADGPQYEISDRGDGWIYFSEMVKEGDLFRLRIKNRPTTFDCFDVENLQ